jgi:ATP adenylyltransferase
MSRCQMCLDFRGLALVDPWNEPLLESSNFAVLPSLGALVEGWLLLVPKCHFISMGALPQSMAGELKDMKDTVRSLLERGYGEVCAFEHGPSKANCSIGCGVDHAHLHMVPLRFDLASATAQFLPEGAAWDEGGLPECGSAFARGQDYLYLEQPIGIGRITEHQAFGSQLFRRAIATQVGAEHEFNWREYPKLSNVMATIDRLRALSGAMATCEKRLAATA